jgi:hypothetical protein
VDEWRGGNVADLQCYLFGKKKSVSLYKFEAIVGNEPELLKIHEIAADLSSMIIDARTCQRYHHKIYFCSTA